MFSVSKMLNNTLVSTRSRSNKSKLELFPSEKWTESTARLRLNKDNKLTVQ